MYRPCIETVRYTIDDNGKEQNIFVRRCYFTEKQMEKVINVVCDEYFTPYYHVVTDKAVNVGMLCNRAASINPYYNEQVRDCLKQYKYFGTGAFLLDDKYKNLNSEVKFDLYKDWQNQTKGYDVLAEEVYNQTLHNAHPLLKKFSTFYKNGLVIKNETNVENVIRPMINKFIDKFKINFEQQEAIEIIKPEEEDTM